MIKASREQLACFKLQNLTVIFLEKIRDGFFVAVGFLTSPGHLA